MRLQEVIENRGEHLGFKRPHWDDFLTFYIDGTVHWFKTGEERKLLLDDFEYDDYELIPWEQNVLSAEESWEKRCYPDQSESCKTAYLSGFDDGKPQGRLEMYLEFEKEFEKNQKEGNFQTFGFSQALQKFKPLET